MASSKLFLAQSGGPGTLVLEGAPGKRLLRTSEDIVRLLEACYTQSARGVLLYPENLPESFFDFELGIVLSVHTKLRLYGARLAIVTEPGEALYSARLGSWNSRESGMPGIGLFPTRQDALDWLTGVKP